MTWQPDKSSLQVMGILNVTPDSFSDGGQYRFLDAALQRVEEMLMEGVDIIDIGGESTRPGAPAVSAPEELDRVIPVIEAIRQRFAVPLSIDTSKPIVMREAVKAGADLLNDVRALQEEGALQVCAELDVPICLMHMQGLPRTMQLEPHYTNVVNEVYGFFEQRIQACEMVGIARDRLILDPGFGFGKNLDHNIDLLRRLKAFSALNLPLLVGLSRKSMLGKLLGERPVEDRLHASIAAAVIAAMQGATIIRVHDVKATNDALKIVKAIIH